MQCRIAITGPSSTGKTTLAEALMKDPAFEACIPTLVPEGARELLREQGYSSFDGLSREDLRGFQRRFLEFKRNAESGVERFLVDRSFVDVAAVWLERDTFDQSAALQSELVGRCRELARSYTLHIHLPFGVIAFTDDGSRERDTLLHQRIGARILQYLDEWGLEYFTVRSTTVKDRVAEVCGELSRRGIISPG